MTTPQRDPGPVTEHAAADAADAADAAQSRPPRVRSRRRRVVGIVAVALLIGAGGAVGWIVSTGAFATADQHTARSQAATEPVVRGDLEESTSASGTLRYDGSRTIQAGTGGTVTGLPASGTVISPGDRLYAIDDVPVFLLRGDVPAWREFASGMDDGRDVRQLEKALRNLGHFGEEPDEEFRWATVEAIMDWQESHDLERTGRLSLGSIVFAGGDLRIGSVTANVGDQVVTGTELFQATDTRQVVEAALSLSLQQLAVVDTAVTVRLPGGGQTTGTIVSVGTPTETEGASGQQVTVIPIVVALDDPKAAADLQEASVTVDIPSRRREDVLSVPVSALLALTPDEFGVEALDADGTTRQIPVETGLFAGGRVEISGPDVTEDMRVVVPRR